MNSTRAALLQNAVDGQSGEAFVYQPMVSADVNARPAADTGRAVADFTGIYSDPHIAPLRRPHARPQGSRHEISAGRPAVKLQAGGLAYAAQIGDRVVRSATGDRFEVAEIAYDGYGRVVLSLTARGT